jgi:phosphoglycerate dehydrogenase-like enzyme
MNKVILIVEPREIAIESINLLRVEGYVICLPTDNYDLAKICGLFIRTYTMATRDYLAQFPNLKFILRAGVGLDNIDLVECKSRNIAVVNAPGSNANAVAEYALLMMLNLSRKVLTQVQLVKDGKWRDFGSIGSELAGKTVGLIGCGAVGKNLAGKLQAFGAKVIGYDGYISYDIMASYGIKKCELDSLLTESDIISINVPLTSETKSMISVREFNQMKKSCILINVSRGEVVSEVELISALTSQTIAYAAIDGGIGEPNINPSLLSVPNLIVTPHIAGFTKEANIAMAVGAVRNFLSSQSHLMTLS